MCALLLLLQLYLYRYLLAENLMLRHQLLVYKRSIQKPRIKQFDRILWVILTGILPADLWKDALAFVKPATVIKWHREAYRSFWKWISRRKKSGRPAIPSLLRDVIRRIAEENPTWGPERILGELQMAGYRLHINTVRIHAKTGKGTRRELEKFPRPSCLADRSHGLLRGSFVELHSSLCLLYHPSCDQRDSACERFGSSRYGLATAESQRGLR